MKMAKNSAVVLTRPLQHCGPLADGMTERGSMSKCRD